MSSPSSTDRSRLTVPIVVAVTLALVTAVLFAIPKAGDDAANPAGSSSQQPPSQSGGDSASGATTDDQARRVANDPLAIGDVDAPVVLINYSEFQCPFCGKFARDTKPTLLKDYVDKGILRIEWRDFPYLGAESRTAANAARAAAAQGKFWEFHDAMFAEQQPPNSGRLTPEYLTKVATSVGIDAARFATDMESDATDKAVTKDFAEGQSIGVTGTPAFLINGRPIMGAQPTEQFVAAIEQAAKTAAP